MMERAPTPDDLIVPLPPDSAVVLVAAVISELATGVPSSSRDPSIVVT